MSSYERKKEKDKVEETTGRGEMRSLIRAGRSTVTRPGESFHVWYTYDTILHLIEAHDLDWVGSSDSTTCQRLTSGSLFSTFCTTPAHTTTHTIQLVIHIIHTLDYASFVLWSPSFPDSHAADNRSSIFFHPSQFAAY